MQKFVSVILCMLMASCSIATVSDERERTYIVIGRVVVPPATAGSQIVRVTSIGTVSSASATSVGIGHHEVVTFPSLCGAVFIEPDEATILRIKEILPDLSSDCIYLRRQ